MKMKIKKIQIWFVVICVFIVLVVSMAALARMDAPKNEAIAFATIGIDQEVMIDETSSYELQRASEHFAYIVLGWMVEPGFALEVDEQLGEDYLGDFAAGDYDFFGIRQEKQNLILTVAATPDVLVDSEPAQILLSVIEDRIADYNESTNAGYVIAVESYSFVEGERSAWRVVAGAVLLALVISVLLLITWENVNFDRNRS